MFKLKPVYWLPLRGWGATATRMLIALIGQKKATFGKDKAAFWVWNQTCGSVTWIVGTLTLTGRFTHGWRDKNTWKRRLYTPLQLVHKCMAKSGGVGCDGAANVEVLQGRVSRWVFWANGRACSWLCFVLLGQHGGVKQDRGFMLLLCVCWWENTGADWGVLMLTPWYSGFVDGVVRRAHLLQTNRTLRLHYITHVPPNKFGFSRQK